MIQRNPTILKQNKNIYKRSNVRKQAKDEYKIKPRQPAITF
jgi:hypothetical protein